jgi:MYND finger
MSDNKPDVRQIKREEQQSIAAAVSDAVHSTPTHVIDEDGTVKEKKPKGNRLMKEILADSKATTKTFFFDKSTVKPQREEQLGKYLISDIPPLVQTEDKETILDEILSETSKEYLDTETKSSTASSPSPPSSKPEMSQNDLEAILDELMLNIAVDACSDVVSRRHEIVTRALTHFGGDYKKLEQAVKERRNGYMARMSTHIPEFAKYYEEMIHTTGDPEKDYKHRAEILKAFLRTADPKTTTNSKSSSPSSEEKNEEFQKDPPKTMFFRRPGPVTTADYVQIIDYMEDNLGRDKYNLDLYRITEGGVEFTKWPGQRLGVVKAIKLTNSGQGIVRLEDLQVFPQIHPRAYKTLNEWRSDMDDNKRKAIYYSRKNPTSMFTFHAEFCYYTHAELQQQPDTVSQGIQGIWKQKEVNFFINAMKNIGFIVKTHEEIIKGEATNPEHKEDLADMAKEMMDIFVKHSKEDAAKTPNGEALEKSTVNGYQFFKEGEKAIFEELGLHDKCFTCKAEAKKEKPLKRCRGCKSAYYCSIECQRKDWTTHAVTCKKMQNDMRTSPKKQ